MANYREKLTKIKAFVFDVDGVLGSDKVLLFPDGDMMRSMNIKDGYAMNYAIRQGYKIAIITGGTSKSVKHRFTRLGIDDVYLESSNKIKDYEHFLEKHGLKNEEILYMGDDMPDYKVMKMVGVATCPVTAANEIKEISHYISDKAGGEGAVRDVIEQVLKVQNKWISAESFIW
ncbi:MAG TPA: HAD hydrolase-like protein [Bacteroidales bacterium]|nr:HAD hydrolase-like protein [Bacteroidales bacterium]